MKLDTTRKVLNRYPIAKRVDIKVMMHIQRLKRKGQWGPLEDIYVRKLRDGSLSLNGKRP
jgi:hypothetical protein